MQKPEYVEFPLLFVHRPQVSNEHPAKATPVAIAVSYTGHFPGSPASSNAQPAVRIEKHSLGVKANEINECTRTGGHAVVGLIGVGSNQTASA